MDNAVTAGLRYFAIVFCIGFALGTLRTLYVAPRTGDLIAVAIELPLMLAASWGVCRRLALRVSPHLAPRLVMGGTGLAVLLGIECAMAVWIFGRTPMDWLAGLATTAGLLGLSGQIGFGLMPLVVRR